MTSQPNGRLVVTLNGGHSDCFATVDLHTFEAKDGALTILRGGDAVAAYPVGAWQGVKYEWD